jgi:hypothetical protein
MPLFKGGDRVRVTDLQHERPGVIGSVEWVRIDPNGTTVCGVVSEDGRHSFNALEGSLELYLSNLPAGSKPGHPTPTNLVVPTQPIPYEETYQHDQSPALETTHRSQEQAGQFSSPNTISKGKSNMKVALTKKSRGQQRTLQKATKGTALVSFTLQDNGDDTFTVLGADGAGNTLDISGVATMTVTSDNLAFLTVDPPVGMTSAMHAVGPVGTCNLTAVATWTDGSVGPFTFVLPIVLATGGPTGIQIQPGTPTVH